MKHLLFLIALISFLGIHQAFACGAKSAKQQQEQDVITYLDNKITPKQKAPMSKPCETKSCQSITYAKDQKMSQPVYDLGTSDYFEY